MAQSLNPYAVQYDNYKRQVDAKEAELVAADRNVATLYAREQSFANPYRPEYPAASADYNNALRARNELFALLRDVMRPELAALKVKMDAMDASIADAAKSGITPEVAVERELAAEANKATVRKILAIGGIALAALIIVLVVRYYRKRRAKA